MTIAFVDILFAIRSLVNGTGPRFAVVMRWHRTRIRLVDGTAVLQKRFCATEWWVVAQVTGLLAAAIVSRSEMAEASG